MKTLRIAISVLFVSLSAAASAADCIDLNFLTDPVLPSARGFTYVGLVPESSVFSATGGVLHMNTVGTGVYAYYQRNGAYDGARDFELTFSMRVTHVTGPFGLDLDVSDAVTDYEFGFMENGVYLPPPSRPFFPLATTTGDFHVYRIAGTAATKTFDLSIDGTPVISGGPISGGDPTNNFVFGDATYDADAEADFQFVRLCQPDAELPVTIDLKPGDANNVVNAKSRGVVPVAILGSTAVPAASIDPTTVTLQGAPALNASLEDVNGDGIVDLMLHFATPSLGLTTSTTEVVLRGRLLSGQPIRGSDTVHVIH